jgi:hypothetical protein
VQAIWVDRDTVKPRQATTSRTQRRRTKQNDEVWLLMRISYRSVQWDQCRGLIPDQVVLRLDLEDQAGAFDRNTSCVSPLRLFEHSFTSGWHSRLQANVVQAVHPPVAAFPASASWFSSTWFGTPNGVDTNDGTSNPRFATSMRAQTATADDTVPLRGDEECRIINDTMGTRGDEQVCSGG